MVFFFSAIVCMAIVVGSVIQSKSHAMKIHAKIEVCALRKMVDFYADAMPGGREQNVKIR